MNDNTWRVIRGLAQGVTAASLIGLWQAFSPWPMTEAQIAALGSVLTVVLTVVLSAAQNAGEQARVIPVLGKKNDDSGPGNPPPPPEIPIIPAVRRVPNAAPAHPSVDPTLTKDSGLGLRPPP